MKIAIVGAGCSAVLLCKELARQGHDAAVSEITVYETTGHFGPGLPYGQATTTPEFILNMATSTLGTDVEHAYGFLKWLKAQPGCETTDLNDYVSRRQMGQYLAKELELARHTLARFNIQLRTLAQTVIDVKAEHPGYTVTTAQGDERFDNVVLAVGHLKKQTPYPDLAHYYANPYHDLERLKTQVRPGATVGILGTKLTAVDMALMLSWLGAGHVAIYSNSGRIPLVRGAVLDNPVGTQRRLPERVSISGFLNSFRRMRSFSAEYKGLFAPLEPLERLQREIQAAAHVRDWQIWLDATKTWIDEFWTRLDTVQKRRFQRKYQGLWMSYRHPMPLDNALKLEALVKAGRVSIHRGYKATRADAQGNILIDLSGQTLSVDYAIDATGFAGNLARLDSPLIENLLDRGLIRQNSHGGIAINPTTHLIDGQRGVYAIGPLTQGSLFYVSAIERLAVHARNLVTHLMTNNSRVQPSLSSLQQ